MREGVEREIDGDFWGWKVCKGGCEEEGWLGKRYQTIRNKRPL